MVKALAVTLVLLAAGLAACGQAAVSPPTSGPGWALLRAETGTQVRDGVAVAPLGTDRLLVSITVPAGGAGCGTPTFVGFDAAGSTMLATITRSPWDASCAYNSSTTYYLALDRVALQAGITEVAISDVWCHTPDDVCNATPIPS